MLGIEDETRGCSNLPVSTKSAGWFCPFEDQQSIPSSFGLMGAGVGGGVGSGRQVEGKEGGVAPTETRRKVMRASRLLTSAVVAAEAWTLAAEARLLHGSQHERRFPFSFARPPHPLAARSPRRRWTAGDDLEDVVEDSGRLYMSGEVGRVRGA